MPSPATPNSRACPPPDLLYQAAGLWVLDTICFHIPMSCFLRTISDWGRARGPRALSQGGPHTNTYVTSVHVEDHGTLSGTGLGLLPQSRAYVWGGCRAH